MTYKSPIPHTPPRYLVVAQALMRDIEQGKYQVGSMLPTEMEICERFGISRYTAREAIRRLTEVGLVTRRAGIGTIVKARTATSRYIASISDPSELFAFTQQTRLEILTEEPVKVTGEWARILPDAQGQVWPCFTALRYVDDSKTPIAHTLILVHPAYAAIRDRIHEPGVTIYRLIEDLHGEHVAELRQEISSMALPKRIATLLKARAGSPALRVLRYYLGSHENLLSVAINTYPHDRFTLTTRWRLDWNAP
jgi:GntR family transcriptional regulator